MKKCPSIQKTTALGLTVALAFITAAGAHANEFDPKTMSPAQNDVLYRNPPADQGSHVASQGSSAYSSACGANTRARYLLIFHPQMHFTKDDLNSFFEEDIVISLRQISGNSYRAHIKHSEIACEDFLNIVQNGGITQAVQPMPEYQGHPSGFRPW